MSTPVTTSAADSAHAREFRIDQDNDADFVDSGPAPVAKATSIPQQNRVPSWQGDLIRSNSNSGSRASSVISTRTRLTVASDDARSIEIQAGAHSFRISRDGGKITDVTPPPPYPGFGDLEGETFYSEREDEVSSEASDDTVGADLQTQFNPAQGSRDYNIHSDDQGAVSEELPPLSQSMFSMAGKWKQALGMSTNATSTNDTARTLRRTQSESSGFGWLRPWSRGAGDSDQLQSNIMNAALAESRHNTSQSSAMGIASKDNAVDDADTSRQFSQNHLAVFDSEAADQQAAEISEHYHNLMRGIDRKYREQLHNKDVEIAKLRELLHEKDVVYRVQLRDRDHTVDSQKSQLQVKEIMINDLKTRFYEFGEEVEKRLEQARNTVEDMWERRWKEHERLLREKLGRSSSPGEAEIRSNVLSPQLDTNQREA